jgi:hypothetical protein
MGLIKMVYVKGLKKGRYRSCVPSVVPKSLGGRERNKSGLKRMMVGHGGGNMAKKHKRVAATSREGLTSEKNNNNNNIE